MSKTINFDTTIKNNITVQEYSSKSKIKGVEIMDLKLFYGEDGFFLEMTRLEEGVLDLVPDYQLKQVSISNTRPNAIKGWHLHKEQDDIWIITPDNHFLVGLFDVREDSPTKGQSMRISLGNYKAHAILIPKGVAHGYRNLSSINGSMIYFANERFDSTNPDEYRLPWDYFEASFWETKNG